MASVVSSIKGAPSRFVYGATKAAVIGMTRSIAVDFVKQNIRCNAICPGTIDTPSLRQRIETLGEEMGGYDKAREWFLSRQPTGKLADADDVAPLIVWLASDESSFRDRAEPHHLRRLVNLAQFRFSSKDASGNAQVLAQFLIPLEPEMCAQFRFSSQKMRQEMRRSWRNS
jgi:NAD(P)-dependent dehydrogenase (short-subunit alcohol dehydrogenase family)